MSRKQKIDWSAPVVHSEEQHPSMIPSGMTPEDYVKFLQPGTKVKVLWWDKKGEYRIDQRRTTVKNVYKGVHCWLVNFTHGTPVDPNRIVLEKFWLDISKNL